MARADSVTARIGCKSVRVVCQASRPPSATAAAKPSPNQVSDAPWFVPELHDVTPARVNALGSMLDFLDDASRASAAILVVPDWGGMAPIDADAEFAETVRALPGTKVLHGFTHTRGERIWDNIWYGTPNEGEFARLGRAEALSRLHAIARLQPADDAAGDGA